MNKVLISGYMGKDPKVFVTDNDKTIVNFSIPVDSGWGDNKQTSWINCVAFGARAEAIGKHFVKGKPIYIDGHIQNRSYEKDGKKVYITEVVVDNFEFALRDKTDEPTRNTNELDIEHDNQVDILDDDDMDGLPF